jgi:integrase
MARTLNRLKASEIGRLGPGRHHDGGGLYLLVGKGGARSWVFRFRRDGKLHDYGLGPVRLVKLSTARLKALECGMSLYAGNNPVEHRRTQRIERALAAARATTFAEMAEQCIAKRATGWRDPRQEGQWRQSLTDYAFPILGHLPVMAVDTELVLKVIEPIWRTKTETADRVRNRIQAVLDFAAAIGLCQGDNPARWRGHLENVLTSRKLLKPVVHRVALPYAEASAFMADLRGQEGVAARALEFAILTATRSEEALGATWGEIGELKDRVWTLPPLRHKAGKRTGKEHRVPLSDRAIAILEEMAAMRINDHVFPGTARDGGQGGMALRRVLAALRDDVDVHGFRSTFRDWAAEEMAYPNEVVEMALAHTIKGQVEAAYRRGDLLDKRRPLMRDWAQYCARQENAEIIRLRHA